MNRFTDQPRGTVTNVRHESTVLKGNPLGDPHERDLFVYLPPGYEESDERYPTVYCLTGFTGRGQMLMNDLPAKVTAAYRAKMSEDSGSPSAAAPASPVVGSSMLCNGVNFSEGVGWPFLLETWGPDGTHAEI